MGKYIKGDVGEDVLIRATHINGYRSGWDDPWGTIAGVRWVNGRPCYEVSFTEPEVIDYWPIHDLSDEYVLTTETRLEAGEG